MACEELVALAIFTSYFTIILVIFLLILSDLYNLSSSHGRRKTRWAFTLLTIGSLVHTWRHMLRFLYWSFRSYETTLSQEPSSLPIMTRVASWVVNTSLFEQAWVSVCFGPFNWWWSQQLCLYTVGAWTVFLTTRGREHGVKHIWAYMLLGQLVAISVASNLFYLALILSSAAPKPRKSKDVRAMSAPASLYIPVFLSLATVAYLPDTTVQDGTFLYTLLAMHSLIFIPLIIPSISGPLPKISFGTLATLLSFLSFILHFRASMLSLRSISPNDGDILSLKTWSTFAASAWNVLHTQHPAQSSIGWDVVWTSASLAIWSAIVQFPNPLPATATSLFPVGSVAPWIFEASAAERVSSRTKES